jgi:hypothetical protein
MEYIQHDREIWAIVPRTGSHELECLDLMLRRGIKRSRHRAFLEKLKRFCCRQSPASEPERSQMTIGSLAPGSIAL